MWPTCAAAVNQSFFDVHCFDPSVSGALRFPEKIDRAAGNPRQGNA